MRAVVDLTDHTVIRGEVEPSALIVGGIMVTPDGKEAQHLGAFVIVRVRNEAEIVAPWLAEIAMMEAEIAAGAATSKASEIRHKMRDDLAHDDPIVERFREVVGTHELLPMAPGEKRYADIPF